MDPNAALERIEHFLQLIGNDGFTINVYRELEEACNDLLGWIERGGFQPRWEEHLEASGHFRVWMMT